MYMYVYEREREREMRKMIFLCELQTVQWSLLMAME